MVIRNPKKKNNNPISIISTDMGKTSDKTIKKTMIRTRDVDDTSTSVNDYTRTIDRNLVLKALKNLQKIELAAISRRVYSENLTFYRFVEYLADILCFY